MYFLLPWLRGDTLWLLGRYLLAFINLIFIGLSLEIVLVFGEYSCFFR